jgi:hypothetical protein
MAPRISHLTRSMKFEEGALYKVEPKFLIRHWYLKLRDNSSRFKNSNESWGYDVLRHLKYEYFRMAAFVAVTWFTSHGH